MSDGDLRHLERQAAAGDERAGKRLRRERMRRGMGMVAHVVQHQVPGKAVAVCDIRIAPLGVRVRGRGGRERATCIIEWSHYFRTSEAKQMLEVTP